MKKKFINSHPFKNPRCLLLYIFIIAFAAGLKADPIAEGFNSYSIQTGYGTFTWAGWQMTNCKGVPLYKYEGSHSLGIYGSLVSPEKTGGVGLINFMYRVESEGMEVNVDIETSEDGLSWSNVGSFTATGTDFQEKTLVVNSANAKYVRVNLPSDDPSKVILLDVMVITDNGTVIATAEVAGVQVLGFETLPFAGNIPITFDNISSDVSLSIDKPLEVLLGKTTLTPSEAIGTYNLPVTFTPTDQSTKAFYSALTLSGGGIPFPPNKVSVYFYQLQETVFEDFEQAFTTAEMGSYAPVSYFTSTGWLIKDGNKSSSYTAFGSTGALNLYGLNKSATSPMMKSGIGTLQMYVHTGYITTSNTNIRVSISSDGINWTEKETLVVAPTINVFKPFEVVINDASAKFIKLEPNASIFVENVTITKNGVGISKVYFEEEPSFGIPAGEEQLVNVKIKGSDISSDLTVEFTSDVFSSEITTIPAADINNKTYTLPVKFKPNATGTLFSGSIKFTSSDAKFVQALDIEGYNLKGFLTELFNSTANFPAMSGTANAYVFNGWKIYGGSKSSGTEMKDGVTYPKYVSSPSAVQLSVTPTIAGRILSPPKSNGVGAIQFLYRNSTSSNINSEPVILVRTYKELTDTPVEVGRIVVPLIDGSPDFLVFEVAVNDADARYVEITTENSPLGNLIVFIDNVVVTANGKGIPTVTVPEKIAVKTYPGESFTYDFQIEMQNVYGDLTLSLEDGANFTVTPTEITPVDGAVLVTAQVTYNPSNTDFMSTDNLTIEGEGLIETVKIPLVGNKLESTISQYFNATGWGSSTSTYLLDGWEMTDSRRQAHPSYIIEGAASLQLYYGGTKNGILTSPEKAGGIKDISFTYNIEYPHKMIVEISEDGETWEEVFADYLWEGSNEDEVINVNKPKAKYMRMYMNFEGAGSQEYYVYIDNVVVTGMPYLRQVGTIEVVETNTVPVTIPVEIAGVLEENATISMAEGETSRFTLSATTVTPENLLETITEPEEMTVPKSFEFELTFTADQSGVYEDEIVIKNGSDEEYLRIPVEVNYSKPYIRLVNPVEAVETNTVPKVIPIEIEGLILADVTISLTGADAANFSLSKTSVTPSELEEGNVSFDVTFTTETAGEYNVNVAIGDYVTVPVKVTYINPHIKLLGTIEPIVTSEVPVEIPIEVNGVITSNVAITLTGNNADKFSLPKTSITPSELEEGSVYFDLTFNAEESGEYNVNVVFGEYLIVPVKVTYNKPYIDLIGEVDPIKTGEKTLQIPVEVKGFITENAVLKLTGENSSNFQLSRTSISPAELEQGNVKFYVTFATTEEQHLIYKANVVISDSEDKEYLLIPISVEYGTGIEGNDYDNMKVYIKNGILYVDNAETGSLVTVFNLQGQALIKEVVSTSHDSFILNTEKGIYIINIGKNTFKVVSR